VISWLAIAAVIITAAALLLRAASGPWRQINPEDHPDDDGDGWPGI
jgi:hypothetical protein